MTKQEYLDKLQKDLEIRGRSQETVKEYRTYVGMFLDFYNKEPETMGEEEISEYLNHTLTVRNNRLLEAPTFKLLYEHSVNCHFIKVDFEEYNFSWYSTETKHRVTSLLSLMRLSVETLLN